MYLAILLVVVAVIVFYNEIKTNMNIAEYALLGIAFIAIIRAAFNYINIDNSIEGFSSYNGNNIIRKKHKTKHTIKKTNGDGDGDGDGDGEQDDTVSDKNEYSSYINNIDNNIGDIVLNTNDSKEYLDTNPEESFSSLSNSINTKNDNQINQNAINEINSLLGIDINSQSKMKFLDMTTNPMTTNPMATNPMATNPMTTNPMTTNPMTTNPMTTAYMLKPTNTNTNTEDINSTFNPQIIIGDSSKGFGSMGNSSSWNSAFNNDGFKFNDTMSPDKNLWRDDHGFYNDKQDNTNTNANEQWNRNLDDYNKGKWDTQSYKRPSDYVDYYSKTTQSSNQSTKPTLMTVDSNGQPKKLCGAYDDLSLDDSGNLIVKDYKDAKKWVPGYTYVPPIHWDVPQRRAGVCNPASPNTQKLTGLIDRGLPINALELNQDGSIADTEDSVGLTNVGSMLPKFNYQEQPFSKPYV